MSQRGFKKQKAFLAAYRETASITKAADACKIRRENHYHWLKRDPEYPTSFARAKKVAGQALVDEAVRRAHEGVLEPVFYKGKPTGVIRVYSDTLLMFLIRGFLPEEFREKPQVELSGLDGGPILLEDKRFAGLSDEELSSLIALAQKIEGAGKTNP